MICRYSFVGKVSLAPADSPQYKCSEPGAHFGTDFSIVIKIPWKFHAALIQFSNLFEVIPAQILHMVTQLCVMTPSAKQ